MTYQPLTTEEWLDRYESLGWAPIPIPPGGKGPRLSRWPELRRDDKTEAEWQALFEDQGIGVILGEASGNLVDIDIDDDIGISVCARLLPSTLRGGRSSRPFTHYFYPVPNLPDDARVIHFTDPVGKDLIMEIRASGHQTLVPPSIHPSGDLYEWAHWEEPTEIGWMQLRAEVAVAAALSLLAKYWPNGSRHHATLALSGALLRDNPGYWGTGHALETAIEAVCTAANDFETEDRMRAVRDTRAKHGTDQPITGWTELTHIYGAYGNASAVQAAKEWMSLLRKDEEPEEDELEEVEEGFSVFPLDERIRIGTLIDEGIPEAAAAYPGFLWENMEHSTFGEAGVGKTMLTCHVLHEVMQQGHNVIWVDFQNGKADLGRRFEALQYDRRLLDERLYVWEYPPADLLRPSVVEELQERIDHLDARVLVLDSLMDVLARARSEMNSGDDYNALHQRALMPLRHTGRVALWAHDHSAKHNDNSSIGTSMKKNNVEVEWKIDNNIGSGTPRTPSRAVGGLGYIVATAKKVRGGMIPKGFRVVWEVEPYGPTKTDPSTGLQTHQFTRVGDAQYYAPGDSIPVPGVQQGSFQPNPNPASGGD